MRGMFAKEDIKKGETLLFVPDPLLLSIERGLDTPLGKPMKEKLNSPRMAVLAI